MSSTNAHSIDMLSGPVFPKILLFSLPLAATGILQLLFNAADVIVVGKFAGGTSLAAVGATSSLINLLIGAFMGISIGVNILIARCIGCRQEENVRRAVHCAFALGLVLGAMVLALGLALCTPLLRLMATPDDVLPLSSLYLRIYFLGVPAALLYNFGAAVLRAFGDTRRPLVFLVISGSVNVVLNLFFVIVCHLGVAGVAIATVVSQYISLALVVRCLMRADDCSHLRLRSIRLYRSEAVQMIRIGLPAGLQSVIFNISNVMIQSSVNSFGAEVMAANTAAANLEQFIYTADNAVFHASITFTSQNFGANRLDRVPRILGACAATVLLIGVPLGVALRLFAAPLLGLYIAKTDPSYAAVLQYGMVRIMYIGSLQFLCGLMELGSGMVRGLGRAWLPMFVSAAGACVLRIVWILSVFRLWHTLPALYLSYPVSWVVTLLAHLGCYCFIFRGMQRRAREYQTVKKE